MEHKLRQILAARQKQRIIGSDRVSAAVLIPIFKKDGDYHILFTKRTENVKTHKGQISFPGGTYEAGDGTLLRTALRECSEEIGLMPKDVEILGELDAKTSLNSNYVISPFVGLVPCPYPFKLNPVETEEIIECAISALLDEKCGREGTVVLDDGKTTTSLVYYCQGKVIWGATARILNQFLDIYRQTLPTGK